MRTQITNRIIDFIYTKFSKIQNFLILLLLTWLTLFYKMKPHINSCTYCSFIKLIDFHWCIFYNHLSNYTGSYWFWCRRPSKSPQWSIILYSLIRCANLRRNPQKMKNLLLASNLYNYLQHLLQSQTEYKISINLIIIAVPIFYPFSD